MTTFSTLIFKDPNRRDKDTIWLCESPEEKYLSEYTGLLDAYNIFACSFKDDFKYYHIVFNLGNGNAEITPNSFKIIPLYGETESEAVDYMVHNLDYMANHYYKELKKEVSDIDLVNSRNMVYSQLIYNPASNVIGCILDTRSKKIVFPGPLKSFEKDCIGSLKQHGYRFLGMDDFKEFIGTIDLTIDSFFRYKKHIIKMVETSLQKEMPELNDMTSYCDFARTITRKIRPVNLYLMVKAIQDNDHRIHEEA